MGLIPIAYVHRSGEIYIGKIYKKILSENHFLKNVTGSLSKNF